MTRPARVLAASIALLLVVAVGTLLVRPLWDMRRDIDAQRGLLAEQLETTQAQLETAREMRQILSTTDRRTVELVTLTRTLEDLAARTAADVDRTTDAALRTEDLAARLLEVARELREIARSTERHAASLDRKTGPTVR